MSQPVHGYLRFCFDLPNALVRSLIPGLLVSRLTERYSSGIHFVIGFRDSPTELALRATQNNSRQVNCGRISHAI